MATYNPKDASHINYLLVESIKIFGITVSTKTKTKTKTTMTGEMAAMGRMLQDIEKCSEPDIPTDGWDFKESDRLLFPTNKGENDLEILTTNFIPNYQNNTEKYLDIIDRNVIFYTIGSFLPSLNFDK